jgi:hypothetical protein
MGASAGNMQWQVHYTANKGINEVGLKALRKIIPNMEAWALANSLVQGEH